MVSLMSLWMCAYSWCCLGLSCVCVCLCVLHHFSTLIFHSLMLSSFCPQQQLQLVLINWKIRILAHAEWCSLTRQLMLRRILAPKQTAVWRKSAVFKSHVTRFSFTVLLQYALPPAGKEVLVDLSKSNNMKYT